MNALPPQLGRGSRSIAQARLISLAQLSRNGRWCVQFDPHSAGFASCAGADGWGAAQGIRRAVKDNWSNMPYTGLLALRRSLPIRRRAIRALPASKASRCQVPQLPSAALGG